MDNLFELLEEQIKDIYSAENQILKALPKMAKAANSLELKKAFETHRAETEQHVKRLTQIAEQLKIKPTGKKCKAMEGLVEEGKEVIEEEGEDSVIDAALIAAAQKVEHYEISAYGSARALAEKLGEEEVADLLQETLDEESATDEKLTQICETIVASAPLREGEESEDESGSEEDSDEEGRPSPRGGREAR